MASGVYIDIQGATAVPGGKVTQETHTANGPADQVGIVWHQHAPSNKRLALLVGLMSVSRGGDGAYA